MYDYRSAGKINDQCPLLSLLLRHGHLLPGLLLHAKWSQ